MLALALTVLAASHSTTIELSKDGQPVPFTAEAIEDGDMTSVAAPDGTARLTFDTSTQNAAIRLIVDDGATLSHRPMRLAAGDRFAPRYTVTLPPRREIGGVVLDSRGSPVEEADVRWVGTTSVGAFTCQSEGKTTTDADGRWQAEAPVDIRGGSITVASEGFATNVATYDMRFDGGQRTFDAAYGLALTQVMLDEASIYGRISNEEGEPIAGARVDLTEPGLWRTSSEPFTLTGPDGFFEFENVPAKPYAVVVQAAGHAPGEARIDPVEQPPLLDLTLPVGSPLRLRVLKPDGTPAANAPIRITTPSLGPFNAGNIYGPDFATDADGLFTWAHAPQPTVMRCDVSVSVKGLGEVRATNRLPGEAVHVLRLDSRTRITVRVVDAATGEPINRAAVTETNRRFRDRRANPESIPAAHWSGGYKPTRSDGSAQWSTGPDEERAKAFRVSKVGYETSYSDVIAIDGRSHFVTVELVPAPLYEGQIVTADGTPAAGVELSFPTPNRSSKLIEGRHRYDHLIDARTDADGRFSLRAAPDDGVIVVHPEHGWRLFRSSQWREFVAQSRPIVLVPWASFHGTLTDRGNPIAEAGITLDYYAHHTLQGLLPPGGRDRAPKEPLRVVFPRETRTGEDGSFRFDHLLSGPAAFVYEPEQPKQQPRPAGLVELRIAANLAPGQTASIAVGRDGRPVRGRVLEPVPGYLGNSRIGQIVRGDSGRPPEIGQPSATVESIRFRVADDGTFETPRIPHNAAGWGFRLWTTTVPNRQPAIRGYFLSETPIVFPPDGSDAIDLGSFIPKPN